MPVESGTAPWIYYVIIKKEFCQTGEGICKFYSKKPISGMTSAKASSKICVAAAAWAY